MLHQSKSIAVFNLFILLASWQNHDDIVNKKNAEYSPVHPYFLLFIMYNVYLYTDSLSILHMDKTNIKQS